VPPTCRTCGATTAAIGKEAGVSNGSLFDYFDTKATLCNELFVALKTEMGATAVAGLPVGSDARGQILQMWTQVLRWATSFPKKRKALARLDVFDAITAVSFQIVSCVRRRRGPVGTKPGQRGDAGGAAGLRTRADEARLRFDAVEPGFSPGSNLECDANVALRLLSKYVLSSLAPYIKYWSTPKRARQSDHQGSARSCADGPCASGGQGPPRGSTTTRRVDRCSARFSSANPAFQDRVVAETRALLATIPKDTATTER
jgi:AcrR family transcriptional regulator